MAGTALIHVTRWRAMSAQKAVRWNRSSRTTVAPATSEASSPTTSALMWKSGSELKPRSVTESRWWRAMARAVWSSWRSVSRISLGVPVVPDVDRTSPPSAGRGVADIPEVDGVPRVGAHPGAPSGRSASGRSKEPLRSTIQSVARPAGAGPVAQHDGRAHPAADGRQLASGAAGSSGAATRPAATTPRKTIEKSTASATAMPTVAPEPMPRSSSSPAHRVVDPADVAERHEAPGAGVLDVRVGGAGQRAEPDELGQIGPERRRPARGRRVEIGDERPGANGSGANGTVSTSSSGRGSA